MPYYAPLAAMPRISMAPRLAEIKASPAPQGLRQSRGVVIASFLLDRANGSRTAAGADHGAGYVVRLIPYRGWLVKGVGGGALVRPGPPRVKGAARPCGTGCAGP